MKIRQNLTLDTLHKNSFITLYAKQRDENSRELKVSLQSGGIEIPIETGSDIILNVERSDKESRNITLSQTSIDDDGCLIIPLPNWMLEISGMCTCSISVIKDGQRFSTLNFNVYVESTPDASGDIPPQEPSYDTEEKTVVFTKNQQIVTPSSGKLLSEVTILKPSQLIPSNIKSGVTIAQVTGTYSGNPATVTTTFMGDGQVITPSEGSLFSKVTIRKPVNLIPSNIKSGVTIAGVVGTCETIESVESLPNANQSNVGKIVLYDGELYICEEVT